MPLNGPSFLATIFNVWILMISNQVSYNPTTKQINILLISTLKAFHKQIRGSHNSTQRTERTRADPLICIRRAGPVGSATQAMTSPDRMPCSSRHKRSSAGTGTGTMRPGLGKFKSRRDSPASAQPDLTSVQSSADSRDRSSTDLQSTLAASGPPPLHSPADFGATGLVAVRQTFWALSADP